MYECSGCGRHGYCSTTCQQADWKIHHCRTTPDHNCLLLHLKVIMYVHVLKNVFNRETSNITKESYVHDEISSSRSDEGIFS